MNHSQTSIVDSLRSIDAFVGPGLADRIADLEWRVKGCNGAVCAERGAAAGVTSGLLAAAYDVKRAAAQIHVIVHAVATLLILPKIIDADERVESVSLGAGNTGKSFDLSTTKRVAEFKFIHWQGGAETMRKKALFKDFYYLAEEPTDRRKELYLLGTSHALRFLRGGSLLKSVASRNVGLWNDIRGVHGDRFQTVGDYYRFRENGVAIIDAIPLVPELARVAAIVDSSMADLDAEA